MTSTGKSSDIIHKLKLLSKTHCSNSNKRRKLLKRVVVSSSTLQEAHDGDGNNEVALSRYLELIPTTQRESITLPIENPTTSTTTTTTTTTTKDENEGKDVESSAGEAAAVEAAVEAEPESKIKLESSKSKSTATSTATATASDDGVSGVAASAAETIQKQSSANGSIEKEKKESDNNNSTKTTTIEKTKICLINQEKDIKRYKEMEDEQINTIQKIDEARNEFYKDQVQKVWGVYTYGLNHVLGLNDLSDAPDAILPGNFLSPPK
jgi:hypothetical protein